MEVRRHWGWVAYQAASTHWLTAYTWLQLQTKGILTPVTSGSSLHV